MSTPLLESTGPGPPAHAPLALRRPLGCAALLLVEYLLISHFFDAGAVTSQALGWGGLRQLGAVGPALLAGGLVLVLLADRATLEALAADLRGRPYAPWLPVAALHLGAYGGLLWTSDRVFGGAARGLPLEGAWVAGWAACALLTVLSVGPLALPRGGLAFLLRRTGGALGGALLVGAFSWWSSSQLAVWLWPPLTAAALEGVSVLLRGLGQPPALGPGPRDIGVDGFFVNIAPECSGLEGLGLMLLLLGGYGLRFRRELRWPHAWALLPLGLLAVWLGNIVRIAALLLVGAHLSPRVALGGFHGKAGWAFFCAVTLGLVALANRSSWLLREPGAAPRGDSPPAGALAASASPSHGRGAVPLLAPLIGLLGAGLVTGLFQAGFDGLYPLRVLAVAAVCVRLRHHYRGLWRPPFSLWGPLCGLSVAALWLALVPVDPAYDAAFAAELAALGEVPRAGWLALRVVGAVITVPLAEELAFRGFLQRRLVCADLSRVDPRRFRLLPWLGASLAFGLLHPAWEAATVAGLGYGLVVFRTGRLADAVIAHATTNLVLSVVVLSSGSWSLF